MRTRRGTSRINFADRLFAANGYALDPAYVTLTHDRYGAPIQALDFEKAREPSRATIDAWVSAQTNKKIESLLSAGSITDQPLRGARVGPTH